MANILNWLFFGLVAGVTAKIILPGQENLGWMRTIFVGILGAFLGGFIAAYMGYNVKIGWNVYGFISAVAGSFILLIINRVVTRS
ncbi:MAG: GlsB/YeaQ/YmgE family stress response membrane protein [Bdellovibrionaceae bacterium]|nr:GlsB/YeaQ/YmgE family stress response membrane protein [Pseudobdellovibrionaceae bacterium]